MHRAYPKPAAKSGRPERVQILCDEKTNTPGADDNWYGDVLVPRQKNPLGGLGVADPIQSTETLTKIQQLFDDAGFKGGPLQTATLRGQIARFLQKHKDDDFR